MARPTDVKALPKFRHTLDGSGFVRQADFDALKRRVDALEKRFNNSRHIDPEC